jgi:hypothetical protein
MRRGDGRVEKRRGRISSMTLMSPWRGTSRYKYWGHPQKCVDSGEVERWEPLLVEDYLQLPKVLSLS